MKIRNRKGMLRASELRKLGLSGKTHEIDCPGEAHTNPHIDNCGTCMPRWAKIELPIEHATVQAWWDFLREKGITS